MLKKGSLDLLIVNLPMKNDESLVVTPCATLHDAFAGNLNYKNQISKNIPLKELVEKYPIIKQKEPKQIGSFFMSNFIIFTTAFYDS